MKRRIRWCAWTEKTEKKTYNGRIQGQKDEARKMRTKSKMKSQKQHEETLIYFTFEPFHPNQTEVGAQLKHCLISDVRNRRTL